ncbi:hypothetical protein ACIB24_20910 [Spongisporangium articulatum]|uniref:Integral membrane protein n=1 Tax=Spongisporangium articulatum TaxID=3362603 RepID=A0ABW8AT28_9ACTN
MVNTFDSSESVSDLRAARFTISAYVVVALGTLVLLAILAKVDPRQAGESAWVHAVIVAFFAALLPLRMRAATAGRVAGLRAVGLIAAALFLVNVVEALLPGTFPGWMRLEMVGIAVMMAVLILLVVRIRLRSHARDAEPAAR